MMRERIKQFSFTGHFKLFGVISLVLVAVGLVGLLLLPFGVQLFHFDIDFVGGVTMQIDLHTPVDAACTEALADIAAESAGVQVYSVTKAGDSGTQVMLKMQAMDSRTRDAVFQAVAAVYGLEAQDLIKSDYVSASVGADLAGKALLASGIAVALILVYIAIRFSFKSGLAAVIALVHDLLVMLSVYVIFQIPFNMNFIAAALTIFGYSINATIVVFDRIRENDKLEENRRLSFAQVVDRSIWQTMSRSLNTTITTLIVMVMLLILGVSSIRNFAAPICVGVLCGCYSSVCISGPLWNILRGKTK